MAETDKVQLDAFKRMTLTSSASATPAAQPDRFRPILIIDEPHHRGSTGRPKGSK